MDKQYKKNFFHAGELAKEVRSFGKNLIIKGASYNHVIQKIKGKIVELGAIPAFPPQIALNDVAAHFLVEPLKDHIFSDEVVKLDVGVCYEGAIGDCAVTIDLSGKYQLLVDAAEAALLAAEKIVQVGLPVGQIGKIIEETIQSFGFNPVRNLSGHGLGYYQIHTPPGIPNYFSQSKAVIKPGMTFAIEPFATNGKGLIYDAGNPTIYSLTSSPKGCSPLASVLVAKIKTFKGLPFAIHDLLGNDDLNDVKMALTELVNKKIVSGYAPLVEEAHGMVAQAENSVLVDEEGKVFITTR